MRNHHTFTVEMTDDESALFERAFPAGTKGDEIAFAHRLRAMLLGMARSELRLLGERAARSRGRLVIPPKPKRDHIAELNAMAARREAKAKYPKANGRA